MSQDDAKAAREAKLAAALRANLRRRKAVGAASKPSPPPVRPSESWDPSGREE